jgi:hypothetical protein
VKQQIKQQSVPLRQRLDPSKENKKEKKDNGEKSATRDWWETFPLPPSQKYDVLFQNDVERGGQERA